LNVNAWAPLKLPAHRATHSTGGTAIAWRWNPNGGLSGILGTVKCCHIVIGISDMHTKCWPEDYDIRPSLPETPPCVGFRAN